MNFEINATWLFMDLSRVPVLLGLIMKLSTARKVSKCGVFYGPYLDTFRIQENKDRKNSAFGHSSRSVHDLIGFLQNFAQGIARKR